MSKTTIILTALLIVALAFGDATLFKVARIDMNPARAINSDGQVVYAGVGGALNIYNIYRRDFPQLINTIEGHSSAISAIIVQNNLLYVLWEKEGLETYDITDRYSPIFMSRFPNSKDEKFKTFTTMDIEGNVMYLGGENFVASVDVNNPLSPVLLNHGGLNGAPMKIDYHNNRLFVAAGKLGLGALFVPNPSQFQFMGSQPGVYTTVKAYKDIILYGRLDDPRPNEASLFGKHLFSFPFDSPTVVKIRDDVIFAGGLSNFAIYKLMSDSPQPQLIWNLPKMPTLDCVLRDNIAYLANSYRGISAFDITDISKPAQIGRLETYDIPRRACIVNDELFVAAGVSGIVKFKISEPQYPEFVLAFAADKLQSAWDVKLHDGYLYVLGARDDFARNIFVERYDTDGNWVAEYPIARVAKLDPIGELSFGEKFCAISLGSEGIAIMKLDNGALIEASSIYDGLVQFCDVEIDGSLLYASDYHGGYHIFKIGNGLPTTISYTKTSDEGGNGIAFAGKYLLCADGPAGLTVIDIRNPEEPKFVSSFATVWGTDIAISGNYAFLSDAQGACKVFDIANLPEVKLVAELPSNGYWMHIYADSRYVYGLDEYFGVYIYELHTDEAEVAKRTPTTPQNTAIVGSFPNPFNAQTKITFSIHERAQADLSIFDASGRKVTTLISDILPTGTYNLTWNAEDTPSGTYFAILKTPNAQVEQKLMLVK